MAEEIQVRVWILVALGMVMSASALWAPVSQATITPAGTATEKASPLVPLEAFFSDPEFSQPQLSPSGNKLAVLHEVAGLPSRNLKVINFSTNKGMVLTAYRQHEIVWYVWLDENRIAYRAEIPSDGETPAAIRGSELFNVVDLSGRRPEITRFSVARKAMSAQRRSAELATWQSLRLLDPRPIDRNHLLVTVRSDNADSPSGVSRDVAASMHPYTDVATVDVRSGRIRRLATNPGQVYHWLVDRDGNARIAMQLDDDLNVNVLHRDKDDEDWKTIHSFSYSEAGVWPLAFASDPNLVYVLSNRERDTKALYTLNLQTGQFDEELFAHDTVDVTGILLSRDGSWAIGARYETDRARIHYFDPYRQAIDTELADALSEYEIDVQFSDDSSIALVTAHNEKNPGRFYRFDTDSGRLRELFRMQSALPEQHLATTRSIDLRARDGQVLHGFLTVPRGSTGPSPMVVIVHGGPHEVRDSWGFDPEVQFLANRGYAVLQVNYRGSGGYGRKFEQMGWGTWGADIQNDIADSVRWSVDEGFGDPDRICIYGWSFGGYSALMNMAINPGLYKCGVSFGGITDLSMLMTEHSPVDPGRQSFLELVLSAENDTEELIQSSPVNRVAELSAPVLVAHGLQDDIVPVSHFEKLLDALAIHDKEGEGLLLEDEGHGLSAEPAKYLFYRKLEDFLSRHLAITEQTTDRS